MNNAYSPQLPLLELDLLRTLCAIADTGSFSAAAEVVHRTPSAVSMQVKRLEELLNRKVFTRDSRSVSLTVDGERVLQHARRVLAMNIDLVAQFRNPDLVGEVRLGAPDDVIERQLPMALRRFAENHPGIVVNVEIAGSEEMVTAIREGRMDVALVTCDAGLEDATTEILYRRRLVWAGRHNGMAAETTPLPLSVWEEDCSWRKSGIDALKAQGRDYRIAFQSAHTAGQRAAILADLAIAPLPISEIDGDIVEVNPALGLPALPTYALGLVTTMDAPAPVRALADHLRACLKDT